MTADYGPSVSRKDVITVMNTCLELGRPLSVKGYGILDPAHAGEVDVVLGPTADPAKAGQYKSSNYVVFALGPVVEGLYDYSLVSDPHGKSLYVVSLSKRALLPRS